MGSIVKIQSHFKKNSACIQVQNLAEERKIQITNLRQAQLKNPEKAVMDEFVTQLKAKNLTPEGFFRICDNAYARRISKESFKNTLVHFKLRLTQT